MIKKQKHAKIIYLGYEYPCPAKDGGQKGILANSLEIAPLIKENDGIFIYTNLHVNEPEDLPDLIKDISEVVDCRWKLPILSENIAKFYNTFFSIYPRAYNRTSSGKLLKRIKSLKPDVIISDGINFFPILKKIYKNSKIIYIANNCETVFSKVPVNMNKGFVKFCYYLQYLKTKFCEQQMLKIVDKIICVSTSDFETISKIHPKKTILCAHNIPDLIKLSDINRNRQSLLFAGPISFLPNYDAVKWICMELAPSLPDNIKIYITGTKPEEVPEEWKKTNVEFLGFLPNNKFQELSLSVGAFICPIIQGSGIKVKLLDALKFNMPIIATEEALEGLKFIDIKPLIDRDNINKTIENILSLLNSKDKYDNLLIEQEQKIKTYQAERKDKLKNTIQTFLNE